MWNAFTEVCIGLLLTLVTLILQFLLSPFTFVVVCMVKCKGIPKFISRSQIPVVLCFGIYLRSFEGDSITLLQGHYDHGSSPTFLLDFLF